MTLEIRDLALTDEAAWHALWNGYLAFYEVDVPPDVTAATWKRLLDPASPMACRVAVKDGVLAGFAIHLNHPSTWVKEDDCYLEDLYIDENLRGAGVGRALLDDLVAICDKNGWARLYWHTDEDNVRARKLYDSYVKSDGHVRYRIKFAKRG